MIKLASDTTKTKQSHDFQCREQTTHVLCSAQQHLHSALNYIQLLIKLQLSIASALISSRLDYANSVLVGCPQKHRLLPVYNERSMHLLELSRSSPLVFLLLHPPTFWNSFVGFLSNGESGSSLLLLFIKIYIPVTRLILH